MKRLWHPLTWTFALTVVALAGGVGNMLLAQRVGAPGLTVGAPSPLLDGRTPVFIENGADPTIPPGFDAPPASVLKFGTKYYWKRGINTGNATTANPGNRVDWELITPSRMATWGLYPAVRFYLLDYDGGSDSASCYVDSTAGATIVPGSNACKTFERLIQILPRWGNGRAAVVLVKPRASGATYRNIANTLDDTADFSAVQGYRTFIVRGSATLLNDTTDRKRVGGITAVTGPNGDGSFTCAAGATTTTLTVPAGSLPTDLNGSGLRVRFSGNITVGLTDVARTIHSQLAGTVTFTTVGTACANGDSFFIEKPGAAVASISVGPWATTENGAEIAGILTTATTDGLKLGVATGQYIFAFLHVTGTGNDILQTQSGGNSGAARFGDFWIDEAGALLRVGGLRFAGALLLRWSANLLIVDSTFLGAQSSRSLDMLGPTQLQLGQSGSVTAAGGILLTACGAAGGSAGALNATPVVIGRQATATIPKTRLLGNGITFSAPLEASGCSGMLAGADITGAAYAIEITNTGGSWRVSDTASTQTTGGIGIGASWGLTLVVDTATSTFTGGAGAIEYPGTAYGTIAGLALTNVVDAQGNNTMAAAASAAARVGQAFLVTNKAGGALQPGNVVKSNGTASQITCAQATTSAAASSVVGVMVTSPANNGNGYMVTAGTPYVLYDGAPTVGGIVYLSPGSSCNATTTVPAVAGSNQKLRLGRAVTASASTGYASWTPDVLAVVADGNP
jgi:hypothetical protein